MILVDDRANSRTALDFAELSIQFYLEMCMGSHTGKTTCWLPCDKEYPRTGIFGTCMAMKHVATTPGP